MGFAIKKQGEICVVDVEGQLIVGNRQELKQKVLDEVLELLNDASLAEIWTQDETIGPSAQGHRV